MAVGLADAVEQRGSGPRRSGPSPRASCARACAGCATTEAGRVEDPHLERLVAAAALGDAELDAGAGLERRWCPRAAPRRARRRRARPPGTGSRSPSRRRTTSPCQWARSDLSSVRRRGPVPRRRPSLCRRPRPGGRRAVSPERSASFMSRSGIRAGRAPASAKPAARTASSSAGRELAVGAAARAAPRRPRPRPAPRGRGPAGRAPVRRPPASTARTATSARSTRAEAVRGDLDAVRDPRGQAGGRRLVPGRQAPAARGLADLRLGEPGVAQRRDRAALGGGPDARAGSRRPRRRRWCRSRRGPARARRPAG